MDPTILQTTYADSQRRQQIAGLCCKPTLLPTERKELGLKKTHTNVFLQITSYIFTTSDQSQHSLNQASQIYIHRLHNWQGQFITGTKI